MNIKEFVSESLKQIIDGVVDAQSHAGGKNAVVVPFHNDHKEIGFDIAVTVVEGNETEGKAGILLKLMRLKVKS